MDTPRFTMATAASPDVSAALAAVVEQARASIVEVRSGGGGTGAGVVWRVGGTVVTNHHVAGGERAQVGLTDGRLLDGRVVSRDPAHDLAVIQIEAANLAPATIADARALRVGELVLALGHPFGLRWAVTLGVVSAALPAQDGSIGRGEFVRADVLLGPGNSGGPLLDARGRVVGINAMVAGGLALAVPSHLVEALLTRTTRPALGIVVRDVELPPRSAAALGIHSAALVVELAPGSAAERAGLLVGDLIMALNGQPIEGASALTTFVVQQLGGPLRLGLLRGGAPLEVVVQSPSLRQAA